MRSGDSTSTAQSLDLAFVVHLSAPVIGVCALGTGGNGQVLGPAVVFWGP